MTKLASLVTARQCRLSSKNTGVNTSFAAGSSKSSTEIASLTGWSYFALPTGPQSMLSSPIRGMPNLRNCEGERQRPLSLQSMGLIERFLQRQPRSVQGQRRTIMLAMSAMAPTAAVTLQCRDRSKSASSSHCSHSPNGIYGMSSAGLLRLDVRELDHLGPLFRFLRNEFSKVGGRHRHRHAANVGEPCLNLGIGEARIELS